MSALDRLLGLLPAWVLVGGKGGVGKTTCAAALALRSAAAGDSTLLVSTDPARSLSDALGQPLDGAPRAVEGTPGLHALQLDAPRAREAFLARWREVLITILDRGTYLDRDDIGGLIDAALPGADEAMALLALLDLERQGTWRRIVVDTAPTGHTLRLLSLPRTFQALVSLLDAMQEKHRFMVRALTHRYHGDEADRFLDGMREDVDALRGTLRDPSRAAMVLVVRPEPLVIAETARYVAALGDESIRAAAIVVNAAAAAPDESEAEALGGLAGVAPAVPRFRVPPLDPPPIGVDAIRRWGRELRDGAPAIGTRSSGRASTRDSRATRRAAVAVAAAIARPLTIVGGKGGVGKTTVSCALAIASADVGRRTLVVSTDPAPSVADALALPVGEEPAPVTDVALLDAQQLDASAAFARFRDRWRERVDALFDSLLGGRLEVAHDRRIVRELLALAPPGIDELYALAVVGEALDDARYDSIVIDPAPTGHLLRLLEMPALALDWTHRLLRLMLKYKPVAGLGEAAEELLAFARRTRALAAILADPRRATMVIVALDEPLVRRESERLVEAVRARGIDVGAIVWNRATPAARDAGVPLPVIPAVPQFQAAAVHPPPRGVAALRRWPGSWHLMAEGAHG